MSPWELEMTQISNREMERNNRLFNRWINTGNGHYWEPEKNVWHKIPAHSTLSFCEAMEWTCEKVPHISRHSWIINHLVCREEEIEDASDLHCGYCRIQHFWTLAQKSIFPSLFPSSGFITPSPSWKRAKILLWFLVSWFSNHWDDTAVTFSPSYEDTTSHEFPGAVMCFISELTWRYCSLSCS